MRCANCDKPIAAFSTPCPHCGFSGDPVLLAELDHIDWLLAEMRKWPARDAADRQHNFLIERQYLARERELDIQLGLIFSPDQAREAWPCFFHLQALLAKLDEWQQASLFNADAAQNLSAETNRQLHELRDKLEGYLSPTYPLSDQDRLVTTNFLLQTIVNARRTAPPLFASTDAETKALAHLLADQERLEILLGLRAAPPAQTPIITPPEATPVEPQTTALSAPLTPPPRPPAPPPIPLRDRFWRTLLSERTLQAMLFLGIFLLFAAAISFVIVGWQDFSAPVRVAIPTGFTALCFALGWYVRNKTHLYRSGVALSAIAALLIPIDFYTLYVNFNISLQFAPIFWLITSLCCLGAYIIATWFIRSRFFGYLVGTAAGSTALALIEVAHQIFDLSLDWRTAGLSLLAACLIIVATVLERRDKQSDAASGRTLFGVRFGASRGFQSRSKTDMQDDVLFAFAEPFRNLALLTVGVLMPLTFGWRYLNRPAFDTLHAAVAINWWVGGFIFGWGAIHYRNRSLGVLAAIALPFATYLAQAALFNQLNINTAWHAVGWALLVPLYFVTGFRLRSRADDSILRAHGRTASGWGVALLVVAALWSLTDLTSGAAAAMAHTILIGAVLLAARLWQRPRYLYGASLFAFTAMAFAMSQAGIAITQMGIGWATLAIVHIVAAVRVGATPTPSASSFDSASLRSGHVAGEGTFARPLIVAGYTIAALALVPALVPYNGDLLAYALGNWLGLTAWGARLAHIGQRGFTPTASPSPVRVLRLRFAPLRTSVQEREVGFWDLGFGSSLFHWLTALPLPIWVWVVFGNLGPLDARAPIALAALAWGMFVLSRRLASLRTDGGYRWPWHLTSLVVSIAAVESAFVVAPDSYAPALTLLAAGALYFADAIVQRQSRELAAGALVFAWGFALLLERLGAPYDAVTLAVSLLVAAYIGVGLWTERQRSAIFTARFLMPLYVAAHIIAAVVLFRVYVRPFNLLFRAEWTDEMRLWGAAAQLVLGVAYAWYAWGRYNKLWSYAAVWLVAAGGGFIALLYSTGSGSLSAKAGLGAIAFILAERTLNSWWRRTLPPFILPSFDGVFRRFINAAPLRTGSSAFILRSRALVRAAWQLYGEPLLATGWLTSFVVIVVSLVRNLVLLGGGRVPQTWAAIGLLMMVGLYALSARMFRRAIFLWLAAPLLFAPWTILTNLGWFVFDTPTAPQFAVSWVVMAWALFATHLWLRHVAPRGYASPLNVVAQLVLPFALAWGMFNVNTSLITVALAIGLYGLAATLDWIGFTGEGLGVGVLRSTKFLYPALGLIPVWYIYLLAWLLPNAQQELYGLLLIAFGPLGLLAGQWFYRLAPRATDSNTQHQLSDAFARPAYLIGYVAAIVGTALVAHIPALLAMVLLYDAALMVASARVFKSPLWLYPATTLVPASLVLAMRESSIAFNRYGWWLSALAAIYFALSWALRRRDATRVFGTPLIVVGFALIALSLPPSSQDQDGALWGYAGAAALYAISAFWLRQPLLLTPASALVVVPYAVTLQKSGVASDYYGLALLPAAALALACGWALDEWFGAVHDFPWDDATRWLAAFAERLTTWWALPLHALGFGLAVFSPLFNGNGADASSRLAINFVLLMPIFGWATYRFRLRVWLFATALAGHFAVGAWLGSQGLSVLRAETWLRFMPLTILTTLTALWIERRRNEGSPLTMDQLVGGWSRPLYALAAFDIFTEQLASVDGTLAAALITFTHALLFALLASAWLSSTIPYLSAALGVFAYVQWLNTLNSGPITGLPVALAQLALGYGLVGFALTFVRERRALPAWLSIWEKSLQYFSLLFSVFILTLMILLGFDIVGWTVRALLGTPLRQIVELPKAQMIVGVLALLGLLYVAAAFTWQRLRFGYLAVGLLLGAWTIHTLYVQQWDDLARVQWYALPAGLYLLAVAYLEWQRGHKDFARWLDYAAVLLMMGSLFWQTLQFGWSYALLLGTEGFGAFWWGSARRLRRFLYIGMVGVVLATVAQLINALQSINQWIVFGLIGLLTVIIAILVERRLEDLKAFREVLETWE